MRRFSGGPSVEQLEDALVLLELLFLCFARDDPFRRGKLAWHASFCARSTLRPRNIALLSVVKYSSRKERKAV